MIDFSDVRIFLCTTPTNMHCSFDSLMGRAEEIFEQDPCSGHLFLFLNRSRDRIKILFWDRDGFCIFYKRLERGTFQLLLTTNDAEGIELDYSQLVRLLGGLDLRTGRRRKRYRRVRSSIFFFCGFYTTLLLPDRNELLQSVVTWMEPTHCRTS